MFAKESHCSFSNEKPKEIWKFRKSYKLNMYKYSNWFAWNNNCSYGTNVIADSGLPELEGQLRLVDKISPSSGRLEILLNGLWGTVYSYHFDFRDAVVACRELGYSRFAQLKRKLVLVVTVYLCVHTCMHSYCNTKQWM